VKQGGRSQVGANPIPIPHPTNLALFGHKITLYRFNQGAHTIGGGSNRSRGAEPPGPLHFNHWLTGLFARRRRKRRQDRAQRRSTTAATGGRAAPQQ